MTAPREAEADWAARLILGECMEAMREMPDDSVDAVVCDPPAGIAFMARAWDSDRGGRDRWVEWLAERLGEALRVAKPGAHALVWALPRTSHWTGTAIEDAGWEVRDVVTHLFGEGFPKSLDLAKQLDKEAGHWRGRAGAVTGQSSSLSGPHYECTEKGEPVTAAAAAAAGWGTGLKPACELWFLARKPFRGSVADNWLAHGVGALHLAACEVGARGGTRQVTPKARPSGNEATTFGASIGSASGGNVESGGRWPANLLLSHDPACDGSGPHHTDVLCVEGCPVRMLNEQSGQSSSSSLPTYKPQDSLYNKSRGGVVGRRVGADDEGGAARFFYVAKPRTREKLAGHTRPMHPTMKGLDLMRWLARLVTPHAGVILDPFMGSGSTGCAAMIEGFRFIGVEMEQEYYDVAVARVADYAFAHGRERPATS